MKLYRLRTLAGFVYFSHPNGSRGAQGQTEWKVERDYTVPFTRYTVCRLERNYVNGVLNRADWYVQYDALTIKDARNFIAANRIKPHQPTMNPNDPYIDDTADGADDTFGL